MDSRERENFLQNTGIWSPLLPILLRSVHCFRPCVMAWISTFTAAFHLPCFRTWKRFRQPGHAGDRTTFEESLLWRTAKRKKTVPARRGRSSPSPAAWTPATPSGGTRSALLTGAGNLCIRPDQAAPDGFTRAWVLIHLAMRGPVRITRNRREVCMAITKDMSTWLPRAMIAMESTPPGLVAR